MVQLNTRVCSSGREAFDAVCADSHGVGLDAEAMKLIPEPIVGGAGRAEVRAPLAIGQFAIRLFTVLP